MTLFLRFRLLVFVCIVHCSPLERNCEKLVEFSMRASIYTELHRPLSAVVDANTSKSACQRDMTQKDQSCCREKITSPRIRYDILGGGGFGGVCLWLPPKAWLKTGPVQLFGDINACWQHVRTQKSIQLFMTSPSPLPNSAAMGAMVIRPGQGVYAGGRMEARGWSRGLQIASSRLSAPP